MTVTLEQCRLLQEELQEATAALTAAEVAVAEITKVTDRLSQQYQIATNWLIEHGQPDDRIALLTDRAVRGR